MFDTRLSLWVTPEMSQEIYRLALKNGSRSRTVAEIVYRGIREYTDKYAYEDLFIEYGESNPRHTAPGWGRWAKWTRVQFRVRARTPSVVNRAAAWAGHPSAASWIRSLLEDEIREVTGVHLREKWAKPAYATVEAAHSD